MDAKTAEIIRCLPGSWRLPNSDSESVTITFYPDGNFAWTVAAYATLQKLKQIGTGPFWRGNWQVRPNNNATPRVTEIAKLVRWTAEDQIASCLSVIGLDVKRTLPPSGPQQLQGAFLILNFTDLSQSILNIKLFGTRLDLANWANNFAELFRDGELRIQELCANTLTLQRRNQSVETWHRVS